MAYKISDFMQYRVFLNIGNTHKLIGEFPIKKYAIKCAEILSEEIKGDEEEEHKSKRIVTSITVEEIAEIQRTIWG